MNKIKETLRIIRSLNITRKTLAIARHQLFSLSDVNGKITTNMEEVVKLFYGDQSDQEDEMESGKMDLEVPSIIEDIINDAFKRMAKGTVEVGLTQN